ncbi:GTPase ObgE [Schleiferilactobacillus shenzhenensis]|uniref:GTPase Obg n=1 Tax=Schleiferilactobacillus shenzhenensis LY-73 TaxID=1231336 RepID=U4TSX7_9LACO|nr:GTPase ObgE [Schleiferilactobacillus shenzhenensis]ERL66535.1 Obg [Schleiferilactobacillus shenzhenensis LY-73]
MFVDTVTINVKAGKGGDGAVAFRHEKFVPFGGPAGGDGGRGGDVVLIADEGQRTLMDFRYQNHFKAKPGQNGMIKGMYGRGSEPVYVKVPAGTVVYDAETGAELGDLTQDKQTLVVAKGGRGGRGNIHFKTPKNTAPEIAENGEPGEERRIRLELRLLADVGLVGYPSVGKSTFLSVVTKAKPKIAAYQFTTLTPNLGMVRLDDGHDFVLADLPGLIAGAADGAGLGFQFLRHVERTRVILHMVDMDPDNGREPMKDFQQILHELGTYDEKLLHRPQIVVPTKIEIPGADERLAAFKKALADSEWAALPVMPVSNVTHAGVQPLLHKTAELLQAVVAADAEQAAEEESAEKTKTYTGPSAEPAFNVTRDEDGVYIVTGDRIERLAKMTNLDHQDSLIRFDRQLHGMGVNDALREAGARDGDTVMIGDLTFDFVE